MKALLDVVKKLPKLNFKIAGQAQPNLDDETYNAIKELKELKNVEFTGYIKRSEINEFFSGAKVLLNTSRSEGFSNTFLEAWANGVPVVTTKNVNPDNLITKYKLGIVADDYADLSQKIIELVNAPDYDEYAKRTYNYVKENHDPKLLSKRLVDFVMHNERK